MGKLRPTEGSRARAHLFLTLQAPPPTLARKPQIFLVHEARPLIFLQLNNSSACFLGNRCF